MLATTLLTATAVFVPATAHATAGSCDPTWPPPANTDPGTTILADPFEDPALPQWSKVDREGDGTVSVDPAYAHSGGCGALLHVTDDPDSRAYLLKKLPAGINEVWADGWFNVVKPGANATSNVPFMRLFNGTNDAANRIVDIYRLNGSGQLWMRTPNGTGLFTYTRLGPTIGIGQWHRLKLHVIASGGASTVEVYLDGTRIYSSDAVWLGVTSLTNLQVAAEHLSQEGDLAVDDLIAKTQVAAAPPGPNPNDQITVEKAEQFIGLGPGQTRTTTVSCPGGYVVLDGSPLVQAVDQGTGTPADIRVLQSQSTARSSYTFTLQNPTTGNAQAKAFVTCVLPTTTDGGVIGVGDPPVYSSAAFGVGSVSRTLSCPSGTTAVAPSYRFTSGQGRMTGSQPTASLGAWTFTITGTSPGNVVLAIRCLSNSTSDGDRLQTQRLTKTVTVAANSTVTTQVSCPVGSNGIVASYSVPSGVHLLGDEPQAMTRVFTLQNTTGSNQTVTLGLLCLSNTTWRVPAGPSSSSLALGSTVRVRSATATVPVRCSSGACRGSLTLTASRGGVLVKRHLRVDSGRDRARMRLTKAARRALASRRVRSVRATFAESSGAMTTSVLRLSRSG